MADKYGKKMRELMVEEMSDIFSAKKGFLFSTMEKIEASRVDEFRKQMRHAGTRYFVIKNKLAGIALEKSGIEGFQDTMEAKQITGVGIIEEDPVAIAKLMVEFAKKNKGFNVSKGYLEGKMLTPDRIKELSDMPGREQLIAMVIGTMNAPITGFVGVLSSVVRSVLYVLNAVKEKKEGQQ